MKFLLALAFALLCVGCDSLQIQQKPQPAPVAPPAHSRFVIYASAGETFLVDSEAGKVWRYDANDKAFLEIPVTSKIINYDSHGNRVPPDPKDPLGILDKPQPKWQIADALLHIYVPTREFGADREEDVAARIRQIERERGVRAWGAENAQSRSLA